MVCGPATFEFNQLSRVTGHTAIYKLYIFKKTKRVENSICSNFFAQRSVNCNFIMFVSASSLMNSVCYKLHISVNRSPAAIWKPRRLQFHFQVANLLTKGVKRGEINICKIGKHRIHFDSRHIKTYFEKKYLILYDMHDALLLYDLVWHQTWIRKWSFVSARYLAFFPLEAVGTLLMCIS